MEDQDKITYFAQTDFRNRKTPFGIKAKDRTRHVYVIGKTGMGKSTLLENMAAQDIMNGEGMAFIDPHGSAVEKLLDYVPQDRIKDVVYFAPFDIEHPVSFNILEDVGPDKRHLVASGLMSVFKKIWVDAWSARMEYILNNILLALLEYPGSTLLGVNRMLADKEYRKAVIDNVQDPSVKSFWVDEFSKYGDKYMQEAGAAIQNKIGQFATNPVIRNIIGQPKSSFDIRKMMDEKKILLINLSKGRIGEGNANLLGGILITKIYLAAMSRADVSNENMKRLPYFYLYVDEFQSFASDSFADILSEARKYHLSLSIAHQYVEQMSEAVRAAVFGNVGTMIVFRVGAFDSEIFEKEFAPQFSAEDIVNLGIFQTYMRLMIDGVGSKPFSAVSMAPISPSHQSHRDEIIAASRATYALPRAQVEEIIHKWHEPIAPAKKERVVRDGDGFISEEKPFRQTFAAPRRPQEAREGYRDRYDTNHKERPTRPNGSEHPARSEGFSGPGRRPPFQKEYREPVRPKENLRSLLEKLAIEPEKPKPEKDQTQPTDQALATSHEENRRQKIEPVSPSILKKSKTPDAQKVADLRALLQKVVPAQTSKNPTSSVPNTASQQARADIKRDSSGKDPKEVPEEVLRSILGS